MLLLLLLVVAAGVVDGLGFGSVVVFLGSEAGSGAGLVVEPGCSGFVLSSHVGETDVSLHTLCISRLPIVGNL